MADAVVFVTDYGLEDTYAAALVGACRRVDPLVPCVDGTHAVPPGDALAGAYHVKAVALAFPAGTVVCAVVDPEVGTARRAVALEADGIRLVAPDTGLATWLWDEAPHDRRRCVALPSAGATASSTFHGRDVFAPAAARLASGAALTDLGRPVPGPHLHPQAFPLRVHDGLEGRVVAVDHFGNVITTVRERDADSRRVLGATWEGGEAPATARTYAEIGAGLAVVVGSAGHLEIAADRRSAADMSGLSPGVVVRILLR